MDKNSQIPRISFTRIIAIICVPFCIIFPLFIWGIISISHKQITEIPVSVTGYITTVVTAILATQHLNKREETKQKNEVIAVTTLDSK